MPVSRSRFRTPNFEFCIPFRKALLASWFPDLQVRLGPPFCVPRPRSAIETRLCRLRSAFCARWFLPPFQRLKLAYCPRSLAPTLVVIRQSGSDPSMPCRAVVSRRRVAHPIRSIQSLSFFPTLLNSMNHVHHFIAWQLEIILILLAGSECTTVGFFGSRSS
jgi:hypothetical protein